MVWRLSRTRLALLSIASSSDAWWSAIFTAQIIAAVFAAYGSGAKGLGGAWTRRSHSSAVTSTGLARQSFSKPGKFHRFGKSLHWCGLTGWIRQFPPESRKLQEPSDWSNRASPLRWRLSRVWPWMNSASVNCEQAVSSRMQQQIKQPYFNKLILAWDDCSVRESRYFNCIWFLSQTLISKLRLTV